jgi:hypothetical protein
MHTIKLNCVTNLSVRVSITVQVRLLCCCGVGCYDTGCCDEEVNHEKRIDVWFST